MGEPNKHNHRLFYVIQDDDLTEDEILEEIKKAHRKGADINPIDKNTELTILQTAKNQNFLTIVRYLKDKISESLALSINMLNVGETSNSQKSLNDKKIVGSSSYNNDNENEASNQNKDKTNKPSSNSKTNQIQKTVNDSIKGLVNEASNSPKSLNDNKIVASSTSINNANQKKDPTNVTSTSAETNPIRKSVNVPGDGSCLFWAVTLAFLFPVRHDSAEFERRFQKLFDTKCPSNISIDNYF
jgi:hypothetical protein